ncbi:hypothetical protein BCON_0367g00010 [Botryotinia convoluta]|uniref:2EXR domain-containing protein n=1 Tax=Botryotinia convoluta TaxID=54673 RepID=A0A4Z1HEH0_9HELO|nr:hypothetical protein BCON_0367g00010 [Botryotinia convoluta]
MLKRLKSDEKAKAAPSIGLFPMDLNSQEQTDAPINQTFTIFPNLPPELQRKIWEFAAIPVPRAIEIHCQRMKYLRNQITKFFFKPINHPLWIQYCTTTNPIPASLLHTCSESRNIALRNYSFHFLLNRPFYSNVDTEILWMRGYAIFGFVQGGNRVRFMAPEDDQYKFWISRYHFRYLAIDHRARLIIHNEGRFAQTEEIFFWNMNFWNRYVLEAPTVEKIYLVYNQPEQRTEALEEAKTLFEHGKIVMAKSSQYANTRVPNKYYCKFTGLRKKYGLGFKVPPVVAILDTELMQQFH